MWVAPDIHLDQSTTFKKTTPFKEYTMKLMSGWRVAYVQPSKTILTLVEGHADLIGCSILSTSFFSFTNNVVLIFSELGGTYLIGA
jgi:hypothetical protein